ncbi:MAG: methylenetetrahydrofolate reductase [Deltaproteobacteria bacterium]|nr:methylenetetrahydrofolate reductase [Deltaproteobacteria bacterium]
MGQTMQNNFPFKPDVRIIDVLQKGRFTLSAEVIPPRNGAEQNEILNQIHSLVQAGAEFLAVTKGAGGSLRGGSLPIAQVIKEKFGVPCIAHFTCRDLLPVEIENQLMDHHYFGVRNILALRGDPPEGQPEWKPRAGGYHYAYKLIQQIKNLNLGHYLPRLHSANLPAQEPTQFCIGAAVYPDYPDLDEQIGFFKQKTDAGAEFAITDMLFDPESYSGFLERCYAQDIKIPILPGTRVLKSRNQVDKMLKKFKLRLPPSLYDALPDRDCEDSIKLGVELFLKLVEQLKAAGAPGVHLFVISDTLGAQTALKELAKNQNQCKS